MYSLEHHEHETGLARPAFGKPVKLQNDLSHLFAFRVIFGSSSIEFVNNFVTPAKLPSYEKLQNVTKCDTFRAFPVPKSFQDTRHLRLRPSSPLMEED